METQTLIQRFGARPEQALDFGRSLWDSFTEDNCQTTAAALTYQTLFAIVPTLVFAYVLFEFFGAGEGLQAEFETFIFSNIVPENASVVQDYLISFSQQARNLGTPSLALLLVTAFLMLFTIERTFNEIWRVREPRHGSQRFLMYWAVLTLGAPFVAASLLVTTYIESLPVISDVSETTRSLHMVPIILGSSFLTLLYTVVPNCHVPVKNAVIGAISVSVSFEFAKVLFAEIMARSNFEAIYGTFAAVPLFLIWIYVSWTIVLFGAELVKNLSVYRFDPDHRVEAPLVQLILILELFYLAHQKGGVLQDRDIRRQSDRIDMVLWSDIRAKLMELNLIKSVDNGGLILSKDLDEVTVWDLYVALSWPLPDGVKGDKFWEQKLSERFQAIATKSKDKLSDNLEELFKASGE